MGHDDRHKNCGGLWVGGRCCRCYAECECAQCKPMPLAVTVEAEPGRKKVVILACARSATLYMHKALKVEGLDVKHECMGADGSVSNYLVPRSTDMPPKSENSGFKYNHHSDGSRAYMYQFDHVFHQVRNPLKVICSFASMFSKKELKWMGPYIREYDPMFNEDMKPIQRSMRYWLFWNKMIEDRWKVTLRYRIEDIDDAWPAIAQCLGLPTKTPPDTKRTTNHKGGTWGPKEWTWEHLEEIDWVLTEQIRNKAREYGYTEGELKDV